MRIAPLLLTGILVATGCSDAVGPEPGIQILGPAGLADTVFAMVETPVVIQVTGDNGKPAAGAAVTISDSSIIMYRTVNGESQVWHGGLVVADGRGRVTLTMQLGWRAGSGWLKASSQGSSARLDVEVLPGAVAGIAVVPADTALVAGSYSLSAYPADRWGNRHAAMVQEMSITTSRPEVAVIEGQSVRAHSIGRAPIDVSTVHGSARVYLSVVPHAVLAVATDDGLVLMDTPGTNIRPVTSNLVKCPRWHPDGERILVDGLRIFTTAGEETRISTGNDDLVAGCGEFTADGEWIYFDGRHVTEPVGTSRIWRVRTDGSQLEQIVNPGPDRSASRASPSPDGDRIVYNESVDMLVQTLATGVVDTIARGGLFWAEGWSPDGGWIALHSGGCTRSYFPRRGVVACSMELGLKRPDGSGLRWFGPSGSPSDAPSFLGGVTWSPDGEWLMGKAFYPDLRIQLVNVGANETLPLNPVTRVSREDYDDPVSWRPPAATSQSRR